MARSVASEEPDQADVRARKRLRLADDDEDSAYASLSSPRVEHKSEYPLYNLGRGIGADMEVASATSKTIRRPKTFLCTFDDCHKAFDRPARLEIHIRSHTHERPFVCEANGCDKSFVRSEHLKAHMTSKHTDVRNYICDYPIRREDDGTVVHCGKSFHTGTRLRRHVAAHEDKEQTKCQDCGQIFRKQETLQRHIRAEHLGEDAFRCTRPDASAEQCGKTFATIGQLKAHESREHTGVRYVCDVCPTSTTGFSTYSDLQAHFKLVHPPLCPLCEEQCVSTRALKAHMDIVHGALPDRQRFECQHPGCGRKFTKKGNLSVHVRSVHARERTFVCGQVDLSENTKLSGWSGIGCGVGFSTKAALEGHVRTQHLTHPGGIRSKHRQSLPHAQIHSISSITGHGYEQQRPIRCLEQTCQSRFRHEHELVVHLELHHGWNIDDINDYLAEALALQGDRFWIGGGDDDDADAHDAPLYQHLANTLSIDQDSGNLPGRISVLDPALQQG